MISDDIKCSRNPIQSESKYESESESESEAESKARAHETSRFEEFWEAYPRHESKQAARKAFDKIKPDDQLFAKMLEAIAAWKESEQWQEDGGRFVPHPSTWLNQKRWEDEMPVRKSAKKADKTVTAQQYQQRDYSEVNKQYRDELDREMEEFMRGRS